jgi:hypothetical protein
MHLRRRGLWNRRGIKGNRQYSCNNCEHYIQMKGMSIKTDRIDGEEAAFRKGRCYLRRTECR